MFLFGGGGPYPCPYLKLLAGLNQWRRFLVMAGGGRNAGDNEGVSRGGSSSAPTGGGVTPKGGCEWELGVDG